MASAILGEPAEDEGWGYPQCRFSPVSVPGYGLPEYVSVGEDASPNQSVAAWRSARKSSGNECTQTVERPDLGQNAYEEYCLLSAGGQSGTLNVPNGPGRWVLSVELHEARAISPSAAADLLHAALTEIHNADQSSSPSPDGSSAELTCPPADAFAAEAGVPMQMAQTTDSGELLKCSYVSTSGEELSKVDVSVFTDTSATIFEALRKGEQPDGDYELNIHEVSDDSVFNAQSSTIDGPNGSVRVALGISMHRQSLFFCMAAVTSGGSLEQFERLARHLDDLSASLCSDEKALRNLGD